MATLDELRNQWTQLYREHLPALARAQDPVQPTWPVHLDHCFARIILDNAVGIDRPWMSAVTAPAVRNMTIDQLQAAVGLGEQLATGEADLNLSNQRSLKLREKSEYGKERKLDAMRSANSSVVGRVKKRDTGTISAYFSPSPSATPTLIDESTTSGSHHSEEMAKTTTESQLKLIASSSSSLTPFRKQILALLCQVPHGSYTTYKAMSDHVSAISRKTCARAVGNAMRNNPFAPDVPCHRVLASDGSLGGFGGDWGENGKHAEQKRALLRSEGVRFDSAGKVRGPPFREFLG